MVINWVCTDGRKGQEGHLWVLSSPRNAGARIADVRAFMFIVTPLHVTSPVGCPEATAPAVPVKAD